MDKTELRRKLKEERAAIIPAIRRSASNRICASVEQFCQKRFINRSDLSFLAYWPLVDKAEIDIRPLIAAWEEYDIDVYLPKITDSNSEKMEAVAFEEGKLTPGKFGLMEPKGNSLEASSIDLIIVPGISFSVSGHRIGYGGGYYDRYLSRIDRRSTVLLGVCYDQLLQDTIPIEKYDLPVDYVCSELRLIECGSELGV